MSILFGLEWQNNIILFGHLGLNNINLFSLKQLNGRERKKKRGSGRRGVGPLAEMGGVRRWAANRERERDRETAEVGRERERDR